MDGLVAVRIVWLTSILVCALAILVGLLTGTGSGDSSQRLPGFEFSAGLDSSPPPPGFTLLDPAAAKSGAAAQEARSAGRKDGAPGDSHSGPGVRPRSGSQPEYTGGSSGPVITRRPKRTQAPGGDPAEAPQAPSVTPPEQSTPPKEPSVDPPKEPLVDPPKPPKPPKEPTVAPPKEPKEPKEPNEPKEPSAAPPKPPKPPQP